MVKSMNFKEERIGKITAIEQILKKYLPVKEGLQKEIMEAMEYSLLAGGKRLRPMLMRETYVLFGGDEELIEPFMAAIEMIHTYSLVHDDLPAMDNDDYRRGRKTTHVVYGEAMGILAGDALLNFGGQVVDVKSAGQTVSKEVLDFIYELKTSALIESSMMIGAVLAGASKTEVQKIEQIAKYVGIAFQIQDDILDVTSTVEVLGKPIHSDEKNEKTTYVTLLGIENAKEAVERLSMEAIHLLHSISGENQFLEMLLKELIYREK